MKQFLKTTILDGILFLLRVAFVLLILNHAFRLASKVVWPISHTLHFDHTISGVGTATILAVVLLITISFAAGIVARTNGGRRISRWFENSLLGGLPQ